MYYLEDNWCELIGDSCMTDKMRKQQQGIWEFLTTEKNYIRRMRVVCEVISLSNNYLYTLSYYLNTSHV